MQNQFSTRSYEVFLFLSHPDAERLWLREKWMRFVPKLSPLMATSRGKAYAKVSQLGPGPGSPNKRAVKFGTVGWSDKSHYKWTHTREEAATGHIDFRSVQFWAPGGGQCERESCPPETFFSLANEEGSKADRHYGYMVALAIAEDREKLVGEASAVVEYLSLVMHPVLRAKTRRIWGGKHDGPPADRQNSIGDTFFVTGLFKPGKRHAGPVTVGDLRGGWELLE
jgi:hypothetical protein